jgi:hypothetical protein
VLDPDLDRLLALDGEVLTVSLDGDYYVRFIVRNVESSAGRRHGLVYSLTLHGPDKGRILGFDNAHPVPPRKRDEPHDHVHVGDTVKPYDYRNAAALLQDFWTAVYSLLHERGIT